MLTCGEPNLSFELPQQFLRTKVDLQLQIKVRFTEVPPFGTADDNSRVVNTTYEIEAPTTQDCPSDAERCTVNADLSERLPNDVAEFVRYRAEALLLVNGVEGRQFSPSTMTVQRDCKLVVHLHERVKLHTLVRGLRAHTVSGGMCLVKLHLLY